jgi:hypothetical protein
MTKEEISALRALGPLPTGQAARLLKVHPHTIIARAQRGEIRAERTASGRWAFHVADYLARLPKTQSQG